MWLLLKRNVRWQVKATLQGGARKGKVSERLKNVGVQCELRRTSKEKKDKSDNGENLDSSCRDVQAEESADSANTLNIESISKSENSAKLSIMIALSTETSSVDENRKKLDMILSQISKLSAKLPDKIKLRKQANIRTFLITSWIVLKLQPIHACL